MRKISYEVVAVLFAYLNASHDRLYYGGSDGCEGGGGHGGGGHGGGQGRVHGDGHQHPRVAVVVGHSVTAESWSLRLTKILLLRCTLSLFVHKMISQSRN